VSDRTENDRLRRLFHEMHAADMPAPAYESPDAATAAPAASASTARPVRSPAIARAAWGLAAAAAAGAVVLALRTAPGTTPAEDETIRLAASLTSWEAPTDFLLTTPGAEFLHSAPRLGTGAETLSGDHSDLLQNEPNENEMEVFE
jgi:hypothetical protein